MISDEAVEAAAKYLSERFFWNGALVNEVAREVLEAAAPHILAPFVEALKVERKRSELLLEIHRTPEESARQAETNPYRSSAS